MANSSDVSAGDTILASQYVNLRADVLNTSTGHTHNGTDSKVIANDAITGAMLNADVVDDSTLEQTGTTLNIKDGGIGASKLGTGATFNSAVTRYYTVCPSDFVPDNDTRQFLITALLAAGVVGQTVVLYANIHLPQGAIMTSVKAYWYRDDASSSGTIALDRVTLSNDNSTEIASVDSNSTAGNHTVEDTTIPYATIDNANYMYNLELIIIANDNVYDCYLKGIVITYTITSPLP
jgi:hypothetical protein